MAAERYYQAHAPLLAERLAWARDRVLDAARRLATAPDDRLLALSVVGRVQEYDAIAALPIEEIDRRAKISRTQRALRRRSRPT